MKKMLVTMLAVALLLALFCGSAMASFGDITIKAAKAYTDSAMTDYAGTIPAYTALVVRANDKFADVYINGKIYYIKPSTLYGKTIFGDYYATINKGTKVYQRASTSARSYTLKKSGKVQICKVRGEWALVQTMGERGLYAFVKIDKLKNITKF